MITKELLEKMRGSLVYCDKTAPGACFKMVLPLADMTVFRKGAAYQPAFAVDKQTLQVVPSNIIYIEDKLSSLEVMKALLKPYPELTLNCYQDPFHGLYHIRSSLPNLIIVDINLPGLNGFDLLQILRADASTQHIPVVALSAGAMPHDIERGLEQGFDEDITRPVNMQQLIGLLNQLLSHKSVA